VGGLSIPAIGGGIRWSNWAKLAHALLKAVWVCHDVTDCRLKLARFGIRVMTIAPGLFKTPHGWMYCQKKYKNP